VGSPWPRPPPVTAALTGITAAVVGVIASLGVYIALHTLFSATNRIDYGPVSLEVPVLASWNPVAVVLTGVAVALLVWRRWSTLRTLGVCALLGAASGLIAPA
jgi:chromate transporter